jgi:hypothetical protein
MANLGDLIGAFLQNAGAPSANQRIDRTLDDLQRGGFGSPAGGGDTGTDLLASIRDAVQGGLAGAARRCTRRWRTRDAGQCSDESARGWQSGSTG